MTSHELAKKLLELPNLVVTVQDGLDPSDLVEVTSAEVAKDKEYYCPYEIRTIFGQPNIEIS